MIILLALLLLSGIWAKLPNYDSYKVYRILPTEERHSKLLVQLAKSKSLDFWTGVTGNGNPIDVMVPPNAQKSFQRILNNHNIKFEVLISNVSKTLHEEYEAEVQVRDVKSGQIDFKKYHSFDEINNYVKRLANDYPDIVTVEEIGKSFEKRILNVVKISKDSYGKKPIIFIDGGIHAREWIASAQTTYIIQQLVEKLENKNLLDKVDWHILPIVNPDGYEYSRSSESRRMWRKTRSKGKCCNGTDGNRNFDFHWGGKESSSSECSQTYEGPKPFSESETQALANYILKHKANIKLYLTFHSYGKIIAYSWGYTNEPPYNADELQKLGEKVAQAIFDASGTNYSVGRIPDVLYLVAGTSNDWVQGVAHVELAYTIELPGGGSKGFILPPSEIIPTVAEMFAGIKAYYDYISIQFSYAKQQN